MKWRKILWKSHNRFVPPFGTVENGKVTPAMPSEMADDFVKRGLAEELPEPGQRKKPGGSKTIKMQDGVEVREK